MPRRKPASNEPAEADVRPVTLESIVDNVGAGILEIVRAPAGLAVPVGEFVIHDATDRRGVETGDVILAVGVDPSDREAAALLRRAGTSRAAGVIFKLEPDAEPPASTLDASADARVAVLGVAPDIVWGQLHTLLRTARAAAGAPGEVGPGGAPVGDLFALANAVASMVGGATTIEDPRSTVLAYSSTDAPIDEARRETILGRRVPEGWLRRLRDDGVFRQVWAGGVVRVDYSATDAQYRTRLAVAVRAGGEILGSIWVMEGDRPLGAEAESALAEAGRIAALHLLRHRSGDDLERRRRGDLLRSVLGGRTPPDVLGSSLAIAPASFVTVVAFELTLNSDASVADQTVIVDRAVALITIHCEAYRRQAATVPEGRIVYVLLPDRSAADPARLVNFASTLVDHLTEDLKVEARAGIGATVSGLDGVLSSRSDADQVLRVLARDTARVVAHIDTIRSRAVLLRLRDLANHDPSLRAGKLERLVAHDRDRRGAYLPTLRAYLDTFGDVAAASASINVHPNTFRYRLRRLLELADLDLADASERLVAHLQLTFLQEDADSEPESQEHP